MTTKLKFIEFTCAAFNCTHNVVLNAVAGKPSVHPELCKQIKALAADEWASLASACAGGSVGDKFLWSITTGADIVL